MSGRDAPSGGAPGAFLAACRRQSAPHRPIWIMRQAGRYLPEYRQLRARVDFETLTRTPELAAEVTLQPLRRFELDAAILFSDIMTPLQGMGVELTFEPAPVVREPIRSAAQIAALPALEPARDVPFVLETIRQVRRGVPRGVPLIGFAGAPFTLLCYLVCGRPSKEFAPARTFLYAQPADAERLLTHLADAMAAYLTAQAAAGAQALMLFESWAGLLGVSEYARFALPAVRRTLAALKPLGVPLIYYLNQGSALMGTVRPRRGRRGRRLALTAFGGTSGARARQSGAGQPRPRGAVRAARRAHAGGRGRTYRSRQRPGTYLQPGPRHLAGHRSGCGGAPRGLRA